MTEEVSGNFEKISFPYIEKKMDKRQTGKRTDRQKRKKTDILKVSETKRQTD